MTKPLGFYIALQSTGILDITFDPAKSAEEALKLNSVNADAGHMPGWLASHGSTVYSISRDGYPDKDGPPGSGGIFAFQRVADSGTSTSSPGLSRVGHASSNGIGGVHCEISPNGKLLAAANITASTLSIYHLSEDGGIGSLAQVIDYSERDPDLKDAHPHQVAFDPSGRYLLVPLRTGDRLDVYAIQDSPEILKKVDSVSIPAPTGPRHVAFNIANADQHFLYLLSEKDNTLRVFAIHYPEKGSTALRLQHLQTLSTLGANEPPTPDEHKTLAGEVAISTDGRFVYATNREIKTFNAPDTIAVYSVNATSQHHHLNLLELQDLPGKHPRMFALSPDRENRWVVVAQLFTQEVVVLERDPKTGVLGAVRGRMNVKGVRSVDCAAGTHDGAGGELTKEEAMQARKEGPVCVLWK